MHSGPCAFGELSVAAIVICVCPVYRAGMPDTLNWRAHASAIHVSVDGDLRVRQIRYSRLAGVHA